MESKKNAYFKKAMQKQLLQEERINDLPKWQIPIVKHYRSKYSITPMYDWYRQLKILGMDVTIQSIFYYDHKMQDWMIHPTFNYTGLFVADLVMRFVNEGNATFTIFGLRGSYKSAIARVIGYVSGIIAGRRWEQEGHIVDTNTDMLELFEQDFPIFDTVILDEQDITMAGQGNYTVFTMSLDIENRIRGRQLNICWCHPQKRTYHQSDYYLETFGANRHTRKIRFLVYNHKFELMGAMEIPMPPDSDFEEYKTGLKSTALDRTRTMEDATLQMKKRVIAELKEDPDYPPYNKNREQRIMYIADKYPKVRTQNMRKSIEILSRKPKNES